MLSKHLLQYVFHMSTTTNGHIASKSQIQQRHSAGCPALYMIALGGSYLSVPTDWIDGIDTPGILNIPTANSLLLSDLETEEIMKICNVC